MLLALALLQGFKLRTLPPPPPPPPPNILILLADDMGVDQVGCYAQAYPGLALPPCTPNIDQLAAGGLRFTNAWSNPVCSPTRALMMTGKRATATGVGNITLAGLISNQNVGLQIYEDTLASILPGYSRAVTGKWHLSDPGQDGSTFDHPLQLGFQSFSGLLYWVRESYSDWTKTLAPPGLQVQNYSVYVTTDTTEDALSRIAMMPEPWLLYVPYLAPHSPNHCPTDEGFDPQNCQSGPCPYSWCLDCPLLVSDLLCQIYGVQACQTRAMSHALDSKIGELLAAVDLDQTVVIFSADNGTPEEAVVPPFDTQHAKGTLFQGGINVPLIVRAPGGAQGLCHDLVSLSDVFATVADVAGVRPPQDPDRDSVSLCQYIYPETYSGAATPREYVYSEHFSSNFVPAPGGEPPPGYEARRHDRTVRNLRFKLVDYHGWDGDLGACSESLHFFQLGADVPQDPALGPDPFEANDLMPLQASWTIEQQTAFADLTLQLSTTYPRLPSMCP